MKDFDDLARANVRQFATNVIEHFHMSNNPIVMSTKNKDRYSAAGEVLLRFDIGISRQQNVKTFRFGQRKQLTVQGV